MESEAGREVLRPRIYTPTIRCDSTSCSGAPAWCSIAAQQGEIGWKRPRGTDFKPQAHIASPRRLLKLLLHLLRPASETKGLSSWHLFQSLSGTPTGLAPVRRAENTTQKAVASILECLRSGSKASRLEVNLPCLPQMLHNCLHAADVKTSQESLPAYVPRLAIESHMSTIVL